MKEPTGPGALATVIAHRGASGEAPENTVAALRLAADQGATCVEIDVSISRDQIPYVHHDDSLDRCTNGSGLLSEQTADALDQLDASHGKEGYLQEPIPRLAAVIDFLSDRKVGLNLEIKPQEGLEQDTVEAICTMIESSWPSDLALVFSSFSQLSLELAHKRLPSVPRGLLVEELPHNWKQLINKYECCNLHCDASQLSEEQARDVLAQSLGVYCYTVNDVDRARELLSWGVHGVFTDYPKMMLASLSS